MIFRCNEFVMKAKDRNPLPIFTIKKGLSMPKLNESLMERSMRLSKFIVWTLVVQTLLCLGGLIGGVLPWVNALFVAVLLVFSWICLGFMYFKSKFTLEQIGIENVQLVGAKLTDEWRDRVWTQRYMTMFDWSRSCKKSGIEF